MYAPDDPIFVDRDLSGAVLVRIPRAFWKIIVVKAKKEKGQAMRRL